MENEASLNLKSNPLRNKKTKYFFIPKSKVYLSFNPTCFTYIKVHIQNLISILWH
jgi:hypothetical protein